MPRYYVIPAYDGWGRVKAYQVCDAVGGFESVHTEFKREDYPDEAVARHLAETLRDDLNSGI
jgi:hypothetical protein